MKTICGAVGRMGVLAFLWGVALPAAMAADDLETSLSIEDGQATVGAHDMDPGWFQSRGSEDLGATDLKATLTLGETTCSEDQELELSSLEDGTVYASATNLTGRPTAYAWTAEVDLSGYVNQWNWYTECDGSRTMHGCDQAIEVKLSVEAIRAGSGECRTEGATVADTGMVACVPGQSEATLPAVQTVAVQATDCQAADCGIGRCVSACQHKCFDHDDAPTDDPEGLRACRQACVCDCMNEVRTDDRCPIPDRCLDGL